MFDKLSRMLQGTGKPEAKGKPGPPGNDLAIEDLINDSGRVNFLRIEEYAKSHQETAFMQFIRRPVLAGAGLFQGTFTTGGEGLGKTKVFMKLPGPEEEALDPEGLKTAIYPMVKRRRESTGVRGVFTIGRTPDNDMVIPDYAISKRHAEIRAGETGYVLRDAGSTNGTSVNDETLTPGGAEMRLKDGDVIKFGRYQFVFLAPDSLFERLRGLDKKPVTTAQTLSEVLSAALQESGETPPQPLTRRR